MVRNVLFNWCRGFLVTGLLAGSVYAVNPQIILKLGETHPKGYPTEVADEEFARLVNEYSQGKIRIEVYPGSQLGEEKAVIEQVQLGAVALTRVSTGAVSTFHKPLGVFSVPYIFDNTEHMWNYLNSADGQSMLDALTTSNFIGLCYYDGGTRSFYSVKPLTKLEDLKGLKIRGMSSPYLLKTIEMFGAVPTPMPLGQIFSALQSGAIDGAENNAPSYFTWNHYQVAKYYLLDYHLRIPEVLIMSKIVWDKLSADDQAVVRKAAVASVKKQRMLWEAQETGDLKKVKAAGAIVTVVKDFAPYKAAVKPLLEEAAKEYGDVLKTIEKARVVKKQAVKKSTGT